MLDAGGLALQITDTEGGANMDPPPQPRCPVQRQQMAGATRAQTQRAVDEGLCFALRYGPNSSLGYRPYGKMASPAQWNVRSAIGREEMRSCNVPGTAQRHHKNGRDRFLVELAKWGLDSQR